MQKIKNIPYGKGDFEAVNAQNKYYVDKTMFIPEVEKTDYVFLIRPRRFGKTLFLSTLQSYYDILKKDKFENLYQDTYILKNPTENRAKYMILYFNFSLISCANHKVQEDFNGYCLTVLNHFMNRYKQYLPENCITEVLKKQTAHEQLGVLCTLLQNNPTKIYLLVDEYDNFTNTLLAEYGCDEYNKIAKKEGYFKEFFKALKALTSGSDAGLARMFITGVSPLTMDDVTSGMNIGKNISTTEKFNELMGFTEKDVSEIIDYYKNAGVFKIDKQESMEIMKKWYDGYKFARRTNSSMYNTDMILYYMTEADNKIYIPDHLIDDNTKTDYGKFKHFTTINSSTGPILNGNFSVLEKIVTDGYIDEYFQTSFSYLEITKPENFVSLLFYFGLLTIDKPMMNLTRFKIANESMKSFLSNFIRSGLVDAGKIKLETHELVHSMSLMMFCGEWDKTINLIAQNLKECTRARDKIDGERHHQAFFKALLNLSSAMIVTSEKAALDGYTDLAIAPFIAMYPDIKYGYLIELKYLKVNETYNEKKIIKEATEQLAKYANDKNIHKEWQVQPDGLITLKNILLVFQGSELKFKGEIDVNN